MNDLVEPVNYCQMENLGLKWLKASSLVNPFNFLLI